MAGECRYQDRAGGRNRSPAIAGRLATGPIMQPPMDIDLIRKTARGRSVEDALALWEQATGEVARSDNWIAIAFEIVRRSRAGVT